MTFGHENASSSSLDVCDVVLEACLVKAFADSSVEKVIAFISITILAISIKVRPVLEYLDVLDLSPKQFSQGVLSRDTLFGHACENLVPPVPEALERQDFISEMSVKVDTIEVTKIIELVTGVGAF